MIAQHQKGHPNRVAFLMLRIDYKICGIRKIRPNPWLKDLARVQDAVRVEDLLDAAHQVQVGFR